MTTMTKESPREFTHDGRRYKAVDNGCYWELHVWLDGSSGWDELLGDEWPPGLPAAYDEATRTILPER